MYLVPTGILYLTSYLIDHYCEDFNNVVEYKRFRLIPECYVMLDITLPYSPSISTTLTTGQTILHDNMINNRPHNQLYKAHGRKSVLLCKYWPSVWYPTY